ncbi:type II CRISPR RNA-guided endonuclease Cas9 [Bacillus sp. SCS-151]|uniref:type II CRISPR RNA-guided endonuclease Cas9 n=1 Tax=Nanhaiella sioensis TaxID=3115293 RepID=UPI0039780723
MKDIDYRIGLDIGTNSIGWGVIQLDYDEIEEKYEKTSIIDMGVRMFDKSEIPKTGASLAEPRRLARSSRRRLNRQKLRKQKIRKLLVEYDVISQEELNKLYPLKKGTVDIWDIRIEGLDRLLNRFEWTRLLIHLSQRRGFKSNRKSELKETETGRVLTNIKENKQRLSSYRTVGEMWMKDPSFRKLERRHNTTEEYVFSVSRFDLESEIKTLFEAQRQFHSEFASEEMQEQYIKIWGHQLPFASGNQILKKVGACSLEDKERRIPKATYTFQYYMVLDKLNNIRIGAKLDPLSNEQRELILDKIFNRTDYLNKKSLPKITYHDIRKWIKLDDSSAFNNLTYDPNETIKKIEQKEFVNIKSFYEIKKCVFNYMGTLEGTKNYTRLDFDTFGFALTVYKTDMDIRSYLKNPTNLSKRSYPNELVEQLLHLSYTKFGHLSFKAIQKLLPVMLEGKTFKQAADFLNYDTTGLKKSERRTLLIKIPEEITNPIVKRALTQSRKVINAIIKRYGSPLSIHIELARELSKDHKERQKIIKEQNENYKRNKGAIKMLIEYGILNPTGHDIVRYKLWKEQGERCPYSLKKIKPDTFFSELRRERGSVPTLDVDHILPYSQSFMDSYHNKVLVYSDENRKKGDKIPYDYLTKNNSNWEAFESYVQSNSSFSKKKKQNLLKKEYSGRERDQIRERHLNDTRYASKFLKNFIEHNLEFKKGQDDNFLKRVQTVNGIITSHIRRRWGLEKERQDTHLHHAMDAVVVACTDHYMVTRMTKYHKNKENLNVHMKTYFPWPWRGFRDELLSKIAVQPIPSEVKGAIESGLELPNYMIVSRMLKRSITGAAHKETIMMKAGVDEKGKTVIAKRVPLKDIKFDKQGDFKMVGKDQDRATYEAIKQRYLDHGQDSNKAFEEVLRKPCNNGVGNPIRKVKVEVESKSFVREVNDGVAQNGELVRIDLFEKEGKLYMVPIYVMDTSLSEFPNKAVTTGKGYDQWITIDETYDFKFSLHPYDLIRVKKAEEDQFFYFITLDINSDRINLKDINKPSKSSEIRFSIKSLDLLEKYEVGILGDIKMVKQEKRQSFRKPKQKINI